MKSMRWPRPYPALFVALAIAGLLGGTRPSGADSGLRPDKEKTMESAKRRVPVVKPLVHQGVRFEVLRRAREHGFSQSGGVVIATEVASGKVLWTRQLYETTFDALEERDVQEIFLTELRYDAKLAAVVATDETKRRWRLSPSDGQSSALPKAVGR